jgi:hypothetical protein
MTDNSRWDAAVRYGVGGLLVLAASGFLALAGYFLWTADWFLPLRHR